MFSYTKMAGVGSYRLVQSLGLVILLFILTGESLVFIKVHIIQRFYIYQSIIVEREMKINVKSTHFRMEVINCFVHVHTTVMGVLVEIVTILTTVGLFVLSAIGIFGDGFLTYKTDFRQYIDRKQTGA